MPIPLNKTSKSALAETIFVTGSRRSDLLIFATILLLMLLAGYRLRVYFWAAEKRQEHKVALPARRLA